MKICALIPSYNEAKTIGSLVERVRAEGLDVVVVDDGSADLTGEAAKQSGAYLLRHENNRGKGASLKEGFYYILNKGYDALITMDGDGQHSPADIAKFVDLAAGSDIGMVVGNRMLSNKDMPLLRWLTNNAMSFLISMVCQRKIPDSQCGFRLFKRELLEELSLTASNFEIESETIIEAHRKGFKIKFVPIQTIYAKEASQINPIIDTIRFFKYILKALCPFLFNKR